MSIPDYQSLMAPILKVAGDGKEHALTQVIEELAVQLKLTDEERRELLPSGLQFKFGNRVGWARTYLKKAGLLESAGRGKFRITERGRGVLADHVDELNTAYLKKFPEFREFQASSNADEREEQQVAASQTPEETLELGYQKL